MAIHSSAARGFQACAEAYERGRPAYAPEAVRRLVRELAIEPGSRALDPRAVARTRGTSRQSRR